MENKDKPKSSHALREENILAFWKENDIFEKSLNKASKGDFVFYEGPPTANGPPGIHHLEARAFKDAIPRYKTMRGYHVRRKGRWDTHGLPVELQVEKELGLKSKKEIDTYGIAAFNRKCKESVWTYVHEWEQFTDRMGYWVDLKHPYVTYKPAYIEALWNIMHVVHEKELLYKDYKVVPWCPRCGTALSSHELAQGYEDVKDLAVTVKFKILDSKSEILSRNKSPIGNQVPTTYLLAWTTTPWTLPGNVGLAVGEKIEYVEIEVRTGNEITGYILAIERINKIFNLELTDKDLIVGRKIISSTKSESTQTEITLINRFKGKDLVGLSYEPLYPFTKENISGPEKDKLMNAYKVYAADFVTTVDGTGIVHTAVMYGQDDFELGTKVNLPKYHLVGEDGRFKAEVGFLAGKFVKDEATDVEIIKDLAHRGLLFAKEKYQHSYPFCWRCHTPLIYFARDSWYIQMSALRHQLVKENEGINWEPDYIKEGRFGEWLREVKDWAISRERYWGTPLPVWVCGKCKKWKIVGSVADVSRKPRNTYYVMRHGEAENNVRKIVSADQNAPFGLTQKGIEDVSKTAESLKKGDLDLIIVSPLLRTKQTAEIVRQKIGLDGRAVIEDDRIRELGFGIWDKKNVSEFEQAHPLESRFNSDNHDGVESYVDLKKRMGDFLYDLEGKYDGKKILIVTHGSPAKILSAAAWGYDRQESLNYEKLAAREKGTMIRLDFQIMPHNGEYELDLHRPFIDDVKLPCACGGEMTRVKEVMDVWFDSGAMPFAQDHLIGIFHKAPENYPADFISEAIDQTRGWFYTLHAVGALMGRGKAYKNVICLGHILDAKGKKMSKSVGNVVNPWEMMDQYGADALRLWMYSVNQPGDSKNFDQKTVDEINKKIFNLAANVLSFYKIYESQEPRVKSQEARIKSLESRASEVQSEIKSPQSTNVIDRWILARLNQLILTVTDGLETYKFFEPVRAIRDFIGDLSQWYLRRSRDRFKGDDEVDKQAALSTTRFVLISLAKVMAPMAPFFAEYMYREIGGSKESVHLEDWPKAGKIDQDILSDMELVRAIASQGLEARMVSKINVRQPLSKLKVRSSKFKDLDAKLVCLIEDEVNVKKVVLDETIQNDVELDTNITPELKEEGDLRELMRSIQDLRKKKGLFVGDTASLMVPKDMEHMVNKYMAELKKSTGLTAIEVGEKFELQP